MARIVGGGPPVNDYEKAVIAHLRDHGPDEWLVLHNIEVPDREETFELDLIVVTGHAVYVIDVKGTRGRIDVSGTRWFPVKRQPFYSPLAKLRKHARVVKGLLVRVNGRLNEAYVHPMVVLAAPNVVLVDPEGRDSGNVSRMASLIEDLSDVSKVPTRFSCDIAPLGTDIINALHGFVRQPTGPPRIGAWRVVERLGGSEEVTEYRARNADAPAGARPVRLRVYRIDPYLPDDEFRAQRLRIGNAYEALSQLPLHPNIVGARHFTSVDDESRFVLELDDVAASALHLHLRDPRLALSMDAKLRVLSDVLRALAHAHGHQVIHRAIDPATIIVCEDGRAMLTGFDYARTGGERDHTVRDTLAEATEAIYRAPECETDLERHSPASDVYAAGVTGYQMLTGELPFASPSERVQRGGVLPVEELAEHAVPDGLVSLLRRMCAPEPNDRPDALEACRELDRVRHGSRGVQRRRERPFGGRGGEYRNLPEGHELTPKYTVRRKLGQGSFGAVYQVYDGLAGTDRVLKLILHDRESPLERLQQEYQILLRLPPHPNVVAVHDADFLPDGHTPYLVFEYIEGTEVSRLTVDEHLLGPADVLRLGTGAARGLEHLHRNGVYHCDIKPGNLLWTDNGCKIIDFNVSVRADSSLATIGGSSRYVPPDASGARAPSHAELVDRDVYALGITLYEALTGAYPWGAKGQPPPGVPPSDPCEITGFRDLAPEVVTALCKAIAPERSDRYRSAEDLRRALEAIDHVWAPRQTQPSIPEVTERVRNRNPFVDFLQTVYSQSTRSNLGTRGRDPAETNLYVATALDTELMPDVLDGRYRMAIITGNAGDGKTAFLERVVDQARDRGATRLRQHAGGASFTLDGRIFLTNHDGSQDDGDRANDEVLKAFFGPLEGADASQWPTTEVRLIAINEGRLVEFLTGHEHEFPRLAAIVHAGLTGSTERDDGVAVVNLNRRRVVDEVDESAGSIFDRVLARLTDERFWDACASCDLAQVCYARHNAATFAQPVVGRRVAERLRALFHLTQLRGRLHITVRDLRSALAYMLTSGRDCAQIHALYQAGGPQPILDGFYFTSWAGGTAPADRLLAELNDLDIAQVSDPGLDRRLDYTGLPGPDAMMTFDRRGDYDARLLDQLFTGLPRGGSAQSAEHRDYLAAARRRYFFECQDDRHWRRMLPYTGAETFLSLLGDPQRASAWLDDLLRAVNRGEGMMREDLLGDGMVLQVRRVRGGTIRSYRHFPRKDFTLHAAGASTSAYLEGGNDHLVLRYGPIEGAGAELSIRLDLFELLCRLRDGYLPGVADLQGRYLDLTTFKNTLSAMPYQQILLTTDGRQVHRVVREAGGRLIMDQVEAQ